MAEVQAKTIALLLIYVNCCLCIVALGTGCWAIDKAIHPGFIIGEGYKLPPDFSPLYFTVGNESTGFFVVFSLIAGVVGVASAIPGLNHIRYWDFASLPAAASAGTIAWSLTLLAFGFACKQTALDARDFLILRDTRLRILEGVIITMSFTQVFYLAVIPEAALRRRA